MKNQHQTNINTQNNQISVEGYLLIGFKHLSHMYLTKTLKT